MSSSQPATDLREAYRVCEPKPLNGEDFDRYYEPLLGEDDFDAVKAIGASLFVQEPREHKTFFVAGHRGCGKTTELNLLVKNWCEDYHVIYIEADKISNINNIDYIDIYLLAALYINIHINTYEISIEPNIIKQFEDVLATIIHCVIEPSPDSEIEDKVSSIKSIAATENFKWVESSTDFSLLLAGLLLKTSELKTTNRFYISYNLAGGKPKNIITYRGAFVTYEDDFKNVFKVLLNDFNKALKKQKNTYKGILLIIDNLDRCSLNTAKAIFNDEIEKLFEIGCNAIYTAPIYYLNQLQKTNINQQDHFLIPLSNIYKFSKNQLNPQTNILSFQKLIALLRRRIDLNVLFDSDRVILELVMSSGGNLMHLMVLLRQAYLSAIGRNRRKASKTDVNYAIEQLQISFERHASNDEFYEDLVMSFYDKTLPEGDSGLLALERGMLLQYRDKKKDLFFPQPVVLQMD
ncbi:MAG: hypothetical protein LH649_17295, partial [Pseudanabaena sp. CAN_BIN31]|nr:hypothetical protein [Pseudanabaena sp. CAN_BIN31]